MATLRLRSPAALCLLALLAVSSTAEGRAQGAKKAAAEKSTAESEAVAAESTRVGGGGGEGVEETQYPFRDLPADVLRDFPGLCFGSTALRLFQVGQSWSLTPFCGVATCMVTRDGYHLIERVQDCGPQPKRNPKCKNVNLNAEAAFPACCPRFKCEEGVKLEYPTQEELQKLAQEAAQAAVRAQYENEEAEAAADGVRQTARVAAAEEETVAEAQAPAESAPEEAVVRSARTVDAESEASDLDEAAPVEELEAVDEEATA